MVKKKYKSFTTSKYFIGESLIEPLIPKDLPNFITKPTNVYYVDINNKEFLKNAPYFSDTRMYYDEDHINLYGAEKLIDFEGVKVASLVKNLTND